MCGLQGKCYKGKFECGGACVGPMSQGGNILPRFVWDPITTPVHSPDQMGVRLVRMADWTRGKVGWCALIPFEHCGDAQCVLAPLTIDRLK